MFGWLKKHTTGTKNTTEDFFCAAVSAFAQYADDTAYHAALLTGVAVLPITRTNFIRYLGWIAGSAEMPDERSIKLLQLATVLLAKRWSVADERPCRDKLKAKDHEYWRAYCSRDAAVFKRRHKDLRVPKLEDGLSPDALAHSIFNDPEVAMALCVKRQDLFDKLVRLGIIDVSSIDSRLRTILNHPERIKGLSESEPVLFQKLVRLGIVVSGPEGV